MSIFQCPECHAPLTQEGDELYCTGGHAFPIVRGIPRFVSDDAMRDTVGSFGDEWNTFNFAEFKQNWLTHTIKNTFGSTDIFRGKVVVDAGAGSGAQSMWIAEAGAETVYSLELSHSIDGPSVQANIGHLSNVKPIQCSIDNPPLADGIADIVYCHNVIQHTESVETTAHALFRLVKPGGELVFNCYNFETGWGYGWKRRMRTVGYGIAYGIVRRWPYWARSLYANIMAALRFVPGLGWSLEAVLLMARGDVPKTGLSLFQWVGKAYRQGRLNTFDMLGSHAYQHIKSETELRALVRALQPDPGLTLNVDKMFENPPPIGCAFRIFKAI